MYNPSRLSANQATSSWAIYTMDSNKYLIDGISSGVMATPPLYGLPVTVVEAFVVSDITYASTNF
jgi:hypothetical protein